MRKNKNLALVVASIFLATLWGCGSNMDSGGDQTGPGTTIADATTVGSDSCKVCHTLAHTADSFPLVGLVTPNALVITHECEACHGGGQFHFGTGPIPYPKPDAARCAACHTAPVEGVIASGKHTTDGQVSCIACHDPLLADKRLVDGKISCSECHTTLTADQIKVSPFSNQIYERFTAGLHTGKHRANTCAACHSHQGAVLMLSQPEKISTKAQIAALAEELTLLGVPNVPTGQTANPAYLKQCATCHDPHTATLRGVGDIKDTFMLQSGTPWERTVYSAEYSLCTSCHQVNLATTWDPTGGYSNAGVIKYELSDVYTKSVANPDPYTNTGIGYHTDSYQRRSFVDTHFAGELYKKLYYYDVKDGVDAARKDRNGNYVVTDAADIVLLQAMYDEYLAAPDNIEIAGFNVNPGSANACSACHDVHGANKLVVPFTSTLNGEKNLEANIADAIAYGEGIGATHGNYTANPFARNVSSSNGDMYASANCTPCHVGRDYVKMTVGATKAELGAPAWNTVSCVSCHETAQNGTAPTTVRTMPAGYEFKFSSGTAVTVDALGTDQICFECHKGRTKVDPSTAVTTVYGVNYLHYSPVFATRMGAEGMIPTYDGKDYSRNWDEAGQYHTFGTNSYPTSCVGCHNLHEEYAPYSSFSNTTYGREQFDTVLTSNLCGSCHYTTAPAQANVARSFNVLKARTKVFADLLFDTILSELAKVVTTNNDAAIIIQGVEGANVILTAEQKTAFTTVLGADYAVGSEVAKQNKRLKIYITGSSRDVTGSRLVNNNLAKAAAIWKNFNYDDKGGWAHNSIMGRQLMYDAIETLDDTKLSELTPRAIAAFGALGLDETRIGTLGLLGSTNNGSLMRYMSVDLGTQRPLPAAP